MNDLLLKNNTKPKKPYNNDPNYIEYLLDQNCWLYVEDYFTEILGYERKRTERSKRPFLLMLLNIEAVSQNGKRREVVNGIASVLFSSTREIDLKGWYRKDAVIGVLFTEINGIDIDKVSLRKKMQNNLADVLGIEQVKKIDISLHVFPEQEGNGDQQSGDSSHSTLYPDLERREKTKKGSILIKKIIDIIGSITGLIIFSPFFLVIPILIKMTSDGPILFRQERVGQFGKRFAFLKFRTMYINNDPKIHQEYIKNFIHEQSSYDANNGKKGAAPVYKIKDDPRVTSVGRFLRMTSLDELPQFINVLKGEMSLVGPRPPVPYETEIYDIWHRRRIIEVKPGITGLWQIKGRSSTTFDEMVRLDIRYIISWSLWLDIKILFKTPWVVFLGKGAY